MPRHSCYARLLIAKRNTAARQGIHVRPFLVSLLWSNQRSSGDLLKIQMGDQLDSKTLLGLYTCTDVPGQFAYRPGVLAQAVTQVSPQPRI